MSWLYSRELVEEYSEDICLDGEPSALWSGTRTQLPSWCSDKTMGRCQLSQSGMTFKPLTGENGEAVLMSFLEAFPVPTSVVQGRERESKENDLPCGNIWQESSVKYDLNSSSWKTHQCLWEEDLQPSSVTLPKWGMMRSGVLLERITSPPLTKEIESGSLQSWPTPAARDYKGANSRDHCKANGTGRKHMDQLPNAVVHGDNNKSKKGQLNPDWTEWLMGWPIGWTSLETITELDWRDWKTDPADEGELPRVATGIQHRIGRLKAIGNGQVPQVAALAWKILTGDRLNPCDNDKDLPSP